LSLLKNWRADQFDGLRLRADHIGLDRTQGADQTPHADTDDSFDANARIDNRLQDAQVRKAARTSTSQGEDRTTVPPRRPLLERVANRLQRARSV
jgi:hypothetical protein